MQEKIIALPDKPGQVPTQDQPFGQPSQGTERCGETYPVNHQRLSVEFMELVDVMERLKRSAELFIDEHFCGFHLGDFRREAKREPEMSSLPGNLFAERDESTSHPGYGLFLGVSHGTAVQIDAPRTVKKFGSIHWSASDTFEVDSHTPQYCS